MSIARSGRWRRASIGVVVAVLVTTAGYAYDMAAGAEEPGGADRRGGEGPVYGPGEVTLALDAHYSQFEVDEIKVRVGTRVRFVLRNEDPIGHELIVGDEAVHAVHTAGTHTEHAPIPGEVSVRALETGVTTFEFDEPGEVEFACHLPGHYESGMHGTIVVLE